MMDRILIVDDVRMNRAILKSIFKDRYEIIEAKNGEEALDIIDRFKGEISLVLLDLVMPGMSGFEVLEERKNRIFFRDIPVVVMTSSEKLSDQIRAFELGANEFILKPLVPEIVLTRVNNLMLSNRRVMSIEMEARKLKAKSELDAMTGLYNKATTEFTINSILGMSEGVLVAMMIIDIDNFKTVNDTLGHHEGDCVIKTVAELIAGHFRKVDVIGRVGGDEFCVLMTDIPNMNIAYAKADELIQLMRYKPNINVPEYVTLSIGMASNERRSVTQAELFQKADDALYRAKEGGKSQYREYGVEPELVSIDKRMTVIVMSRYRNISSIMRALMPGNVRIIEVENPEELGRVERELAATVKLVYADISHGEGDRKLYWEQLAMIDWLNMKDVYAICKEGSVKQYSKALQHGSGDIVLFPIDHGSIRRRTLVKLEPDNN